MESITILLVSDDSPLNNVLHSLHFELCFLRLRGQGCVMVAYLKDKKEVEACMVVYC